MDDISDLVEQLRTMAIRGSDPEQDHCDADNLLLAIITRLADPMTAAQIAQDFHRIEKWYA